MPSDEVAFPLRGRDTTGGPSRTFEIQVAKNSPTRTRIPRSCSYFISELHFVSGPAGLGQLLWWPYLTMQWACQHFLTHGCEHRSSLRIVHTTWFSFLGELIGYNPFDRLFMCQCTTSTWLCSSPIEGEDRYLLNLTGLLDIQRLSSFSVPVVGSQRQRILISRSVCHGSEYCNWQLPDWAQGFNWWDRLRIGGYPALHDVKTWKR